MKLLTIVYIANATILILHEIESAYEEEWLLFGLPGGITGFLLLHAPFLFVVFWGVLEIEKSTPMGHILSLIAGILGLAPFFVHTVILKEGGSFNRAISQIIIFLNVISGAALIFLSITGLA